MEGRRYNSASLLAASPTTPRGPSFPGQNNGPVVVVRIHHGQGLFERFPPACDGAPGSGFPVPRPGSRPGPERLSGASPGPVEAIPCGRRR